MLYNIIIKIVKVFCKICFKINVKGLENVPKDGPAIICINHISFWDPVLIACFMPRPVRFMAKAELEKAFFVGWILKLINVIFVKRGASDIAALKMSLKVLENGEVFGIFPTGTRSKINKDAGPQMGVAFIGVKSEAPIVPIHIDADYKLFSKVNITVGEKRYLKADEGQKVTREDYENMSKNLYDELLKLN